jgi:hypothetical protein
VLRAGIRKLVGGYNIFGRLGDGDFYHPEFYTVHSNHRQLLFWVAGFWSGIHLVLLNQTPDPISPWLLLAAIYGKPGLPLDLDHIRTLDPSSATLLEPWFGFSERDTIGHDVQAAIPQLLMMYLDIREVKLSAVHKM